METWDVIVTSYDTSDKITFETAEVNCLHSDSNPFQKDSSQVNNGILLNDYDIVNTAFGCPVHALSILRFPLVSTKSGIWLIARLQLYAY